MTAPPFYLGMPGGHTALITHVQSGQYEGVMSYGNDLGPCAFSFYCTHWCRVISREEAATFGNDRLIRYGDKMMT